MRSNLLLATIFLVTFVPLMLVTTSATAGESGQDLFIGSNCNNCHTVSTVGIEAKMKSEKMRGPDLKGVTDRHDKALLASFLRKEKTINDKSHKIAFKGSDEELATILDWLDKQK